MGDEDAGPSTTAPSGGGGGGGFKKKGKFGRGNVRKRAAADDGSDGEDAARGAGRSSVVAPAEKKKRANAIGGTTARDDKEKLQVFTFAGDRTLQQRGDGGATAELQIDTEKHLDGRAMREKVLKTAAERAEGFVDDKQYKGMNNYVDYRAGFRQEHSIASEKGAGAHGPMRASSNVRMTFIMDYKPDICKDYKETGYCGYGDGCKFMHDRGDYKHGWQLDKEWDQKEKLRKEKLQALERMERALGEDGEALRGSDDEYDSDDDVPPTCGICDEPWDKVRDPVVTRCKHYFCEHCALRHNAKEKACATCGKPTGGTFNTAKEITRRVKEMKESGQTRWGKKKAKQAKVVDGEFGFVGSQGWLLG
jgi:RING finger protein 113A